LEDAAKPTVLIYGHGDVVRGFDNEWRAGLDPYGLEQFKPRHFAALRAECVKNIGRSDMGHFALDFTVKQSMHGGHAEPDRLAPLTTVSHCKRVFSLRLRRLTTKSLAALS
jgi:hypothetical protein